MSRPLPRVGRYELREELGRGGVGAVYRALDPTTGREVAVKVLLAAAHLEPEDLARFRVEAAAGQRLRHPGIVSVREAGVADGVQFIVMDLVEGGSLRDRLKAGPLPPVEAARLIEKLARALSYAHAQGVLHRDIKPANVLLTPKGDPLLTDFGMAQLVGAERLTRTGDVLGTPHYMPPEQARGDRSQHRPWTDVYALGVTLYQLLTGFTPFSGASALEVIQSVLTDEPARPTTLRPEVDPALEEICLRAMARTPARRYVTAEALADALAAWLDGPPLPARARPGRGALVAGGVVLAALVVAGGVAVAVAGGESGEVAAVTTTAVPTATAKDERHELAMKVHALVSQAAERVRARDMRGSEELLTRALELDPQNGDALARRAFARAVLDDLPGALADADRALELAPESGLAHQARATVAVVGGDYDRAEVELSRSIELAPRDGDLWVERAQVRGAQQLYGRALEDLRRAVDLPLRAYTVAHLRGLMARFLWADGRREQALEEVERSLALDPEASVALEVRAASRLDRQDARGALEDAARADAIAESHESASVLGLARAALGDVRARSDLQRAVRLARDPTQRANAAGALGQVSQHIYTQLNALAVRDTAAAIVEADRVLEADPSFELLRHLRGRLRAFTGDLPGARADFDRIVADGGPGVVSALLERALVHVGLGDVRAALADADRAVALNPDEAGAWRIRGRVRGEADDHAGGLADLDRAIALRDDPASRLWRGALRVGHGDAEGALDDLARAEQGRPLPADLAAVRLFRCMALLALGRLVDARAESERAVREAPPGAPDVWSMHSEVLLHLRRTEEAIAAADRAVELAPGDAVHRLRRATAHLVAHDLPRARADLDHGLRQSGEGIVAKRLRALERRIDAFLDSSAALKRRDEPAARAVMDALVQGAPDDVAARVMHAHFLIAIGDRAAARQAAERALALAPHDLHARAVHADLVPPEEGLADLAFVLAISPDDLELLVRRADLLGRLGRDDEARADLQRAATSPASTPFALLFRARARLHVGDVGGARADLDASLAQDDLPQARLERAHLTRFYAPEVAIDDLERLARVLRTGPTFEASQRELGHARRALEGGAVAPCDWPHLHPETAPAPAPR